MNFKVIMAEDGNKLYLISEEYGLRYYPVGRFVGNFLQGNPTETAMKGGAQWISLTFHILDTMVMVCKKEASMARPDVAPMFTKDAGPIKGFFELLDKCGKTQYNRVSHKLDCNGIGKAMGIFPDENHVLAIADVCACKE